VITVNGKDYTYCTSSFVADGTIATSEFDIALGDTFLRNVYSLYDFGDTLPDGSIGDAYIQLLAKTDMSKATSDYASSRQNALKNYTDPELSPLQLVKLILTDSDSGDSASDVSVDNKDETRLAESSSSDSNLVASYGPAIIGLLAANIVIGLILIALGILQCIRRGTSSEARTLNPHYVPVRNKVEESNIGHYPKPYGD